MNVSKEKLEALWAELNEWRWPEELGERSVHKDGKDDCRGAIAVIQALLHPLKAKRRAGSATGDA